MRVKRKLTPEQKARQAVASRAWYRRNKDRARAADRTWHEQNKEKVQAANRAWRERNKERRAATERARNKANPGASAKRSHSWYIRNKERKAQYWREYQAANKEQVAATRRAWHDLNPYRTLLQNAKTRAKEDNLPFDLTPSDIVVPQTCPVFGIVLERGKRRCSSNSPTLDRIIPAKGYVRGNVAVVSHYANSLKGKATADQHRRIADWMDSFSP